jgi:hypothetical protein
MMLGVSYTNDLAEMRALNYLKTWLLNNPEYQVSFFFVMMSLVVGLHPSLSSNETDRRNDKNEGTISGI